MRPGYDATARGGRSKGRSGRCRGSEGTALRLRARERAQRGDTTAGCCRDRRASAARRGGRGCTFPRARVPLQGRGDEITCLSTAGTHDVRVRVRDSRPSLLMNSVRAACEVGPTRHARGVACRRVTVRGRLYSYKWESALAGRLLAPRALVKLLREACETCVALLLASLASLI